MNLRLFRISLFILLGCLIGAIFRIWNLLKGIPIQSDLVVTGMSLAAPLILCYISNKYWRLGLLFIMGYSISEELAAFISKQSVNGALFLNLLSLLFLIPASIYFFKLKTK